MSNSQSGTFRSAPNLKSTKSATRTGIFSSLIVRSLIVVVIPVMIVQLIAAGIFYDVHWRSVTNRLVQSVRGEMVSYITIVKHHPEALARLQEISEKRLETRVSFFPGAHLEEKPEKKFEWFFRVPFSTSIYVLDQYPVHFYRNPWEERRFIYRVEIEEGVVEMDFIDKRVVSPTIATYLTWLFCSFVVMASLGAYFMQAQMRPILSLARAASRYGEGKQTGKLQVRGAKEVRIACMAFNDMRWRMEDFRNQQKEMLMALSHDVRTPLARIRVQSSFLSPVKEREALQQDVAMIDAMLKKFIDFAVDRRAETIIDIDIDKVLRSLIGLYRKEFDIVFEDSKKGCFLRGQQHAITRLFSNLLDNAQAHATKLLISVYASKEGARVIFEDNGPGISPSMRNKVLRPFFRLDRERTLYHGIAPGLGLTLCAQIMSEHHGTLKLSKSKKYGGLKVTLDFSQNEHL